MIDLHLHIDGSIPPRIVRELAAIGGVDVPEDDGELDGLLGVGPDCRDLNAYLARFDLPLRLLQTPQALELCTYELCLDLLKEGMLYAELRFAPGSLTRKGASQEEMTEAAVRGIDRALKKAGPEQETSFRRFGLILCFMRGRGNEADNEETLRIAHRFFERGEISALDLAGAEGLFATADYAPLFAKAASLGIPFTIHAGEAAGPESIRAALSMGACRIGHGIRCFEDEELTQELARRQIPLECCPTSNRNCQCLPESIPYPLLKLLDRGVRVTVNTDNRTISSTTLEREFEVLGGMGMTRRQKEVLLMNSVHAAFLTPEEKIKLKEAVKNRLTEG